VRVHTLLTLGFFITTVTLPAYVILGYWFLLQLLLGTVGALGGARAGSLLGACRWLSSPGWCSSSCSRMPSSWSGVAEG